MQEQAYAISVLDLKEQYQTAAPLNKLLRIVLRASRLEKTVGLGSQL